MSLTFEAFEAAVVDGRRQRSETTPRGTLRGIPLRSGTGDGPVAYTLGRTPLTREEARALFPLETGDERAVAEIAGMDERGLLDLVVGNPEYLGDPYYAVFAGPIRRRHAELVAARDPGKGVVGGPGWGLMRGTTG